MPAVFEGVPRMPTVASPEVTVSWRPAAQRVANARAGVVARLVESPVDYRGGGAHLRILCSTLRRQCGSRLFFASMTHWSFRTTATMLDSAGWTRHHQRSSLCVCERSVPQHLSRAWRTIRCRSGKAEAARSLPCLRAPFLTQGSIVGVGRIAKNTLTIQLSSSPSPSQRGSKYGLGEARVYVKTELGIECAVEQSGVP